MTILLFLLNMSTAMLGPLTQHGLKLPLVLLEVIRPEVRFVKSYDHHLVKHELSEESADPKPLAVIEGVVILDVLLVDLGVPEMEVLFAYSSNCFE